MQQLSFLLVLLTLNFNSLAGKPVELVKPVKGDFEFKPTSNQRVFPRLDRRLNQIGVRLRTPLVLANFQEFAMSSTAIEETQPDSPSLDHRLVKDPNRAFMQSLILPGMGQIYTESKRGYAWLGTEVALLVSYVVVRRQAKSLESDYVHRVKDGVAFEGPTKFDQWNMEDFEHATMYDNWHNVYNESNGEPSHPRIGKWYWKDRKQFKDITRKKEEEDSPQREIALKSRQDSNSTYERARSVLGLVILTHLASAVDARISAKLFNQRHQLSESLDLEFALRPQLTTVGKRGRLHRFPPYKVENRIVFRF